MENNQIPSDEIDLGQIFVKIGDLFKGIVRGIIKFLALIRNVPVENRWVFLILILAGGVIGLVYSSFLGKKFYESSMILNSDHLNKKIVDNSIDNLNLLAEEKTSIGLSNALHISESLAANIRDFRAQPFVSEKEMVEMEVLKEQLKGVAAKNQTVADQVVSRIELANQHSFELVVRTYSATAILPLQDAIVNYFKNIAFIRKRMEINKTTLELRKQKLVSESRKLDSLKKVIYSNYESMAEQTKLSRQGSNNVILSDKSVTNPLDVYSQDLTLNEKILEIDRQLYIQPDFEVVVGFTEFSEPASAGKVKIVAAGMLIGFLFGYIVVALRKIDKYLAEVK